MARGDHIFVNCQSRTVVYQHHGIDMGDGTVMHLAPADGEPIALRDDGTRFSVRRDSLEEFSRGRRIHVVQYDRRHKADETIQAAEAQLGRSGYHLLDNNCEHFATMCATGRYESRQIDLGEASMSSVTSAATKAFWIASKRLGVQYLVPRAIKVHPIGLLADGVELAILTVGCQSGMSSVTTKRLARVGGAVAAAGLGAVVGGPAGAAALVAGHTGSTVIAEQISTGVRKLLSGSITPPAGGVGT